MMLQRILKSNWLIPAILFFFALASFGIYIPHLGLFGDDWIYLYSYHVSGSSGYPLFVSYDRPYSAWIYQLTSFLFHENVWMYHTFLFILRWLSGVLCWLILRELWPQQQRQTAAIAILFSIFPAFLQQAISLEFILHFTVLDACLLSIYFMILAVKHQKIALWYTLAAVLLACCHFSLEYFVGLELARPVILFFLLRRKENQKVNLGLLLKKWLPYLAVIAAFGFWRVFIFKFPSYKPHFFSDLIAQPGTAIRDLLARIVSDAKIVFFSAWKQVFQVQDGNISRKFWLLVLAAFLISIACFYFIKREKDIRVSARINLERWPFIAILSGVFLFFVCGWPFWVTQVPLELAFPWDRTILAFMLASSFWVVGLVDLFFRPKLQPVILAVILSFSVSFHYFNARIYEKEHEALQQYFGQLSWRIPELKPGTIFVTQDLPLFRESDNDLAGALNWLFDEGRRSVNLSTLMFDFTSRDTSVLPLIEPDQPVEHSIRSLKFSSTTSEILTTYWNGSDCVWLLFADEAQPAGIPAPLREYIVLSEDDQILPAKSVEGREMPKVFDGEPDKGWCYYYQKAALAQQTEDWKEVIRLAEESSQLGFKANNDFEVLPFIEAYLQSADYDQAFNVSEKIQNKVDYASAVCDLWSRIEQDTPNFVSDSRLTTIQTDFNCNP